MYVSFTTMFRTTTKIAQYHKRKHNDNIIIIIMSLLSTIYDDQYFTYSKPEMITRNKKLRLSTSFLHEKQICTEII